MHGKVIKNSWQPTDIILPSQTKKPLDKDWDFHPKGAEQLCSG